MVSAQERGSKTEQPDLSPLGEMVGVKRELERLVGQGRPLEKSAVIDVLAAQQSALTNTRGFEKKAQVLQQVIEELGEHEEVSIESILKAAGVSQTKPVSSKGGLRGLFGRR